MEKESFSAYKDENNVVRILNHNQAPIRKTTENSLQLAKEYIREVADQYQINRDLLKQLDSHLSNSLAGVQ
jgi:hypothetical protein